MLNMKVLDYRITSDSNGVTVAKVRRDKENEIVLNDKGQELTFNARYYSNLEMALKGIQKDYTMGEGTDIQTITDYRKAFADIHKAFETELELIENATNS